MATDIKVDLIDYTGAGMGNPADYAARLLIYVKNTRLTQGETTRQEIAKMGAETIKTELDYIAKTIRSSWEFVCYTWEIKNVTRAFTHQFVRTRTASYAQQAQRVVDMSSFETRLPQTVHDVDHGDQWNDLMEQIADTYRYYHDHDVPAQDCRGVLPTNVYTNIIAKMNLRTLADLVGKRDNPRAQDEYGEVIVAMQETAMQVHPWIGPFLKPERTNTPALDKLLRELLGKASPIDKPALNAALKEVDTLKSIWG